MNARRISQICALAFLIAACSAVFIGQSEPVSANHRSLYLEKYFVKEFIESPPAAFRVADCGGGHTHASLIQGAVDRWNATNKVRFSYVANDTVVCDAAGMPTVNGVISVFHNASLRTGDFFPIKTDALSEPFRQND